MEHILSLSYGKDSLACLEACKLLGYPIDRVIHAEVWATDTIPADLPPMVEFKKKADRIIKERYGITVEHTSAERERERESELVTNPSSTPSSPKDSMLEESTVFLCNEDNGVPLTSRPKFSPELQKVTFESLFYHIPKRKNPTEKNEGQITGFPHTMGAWCNTKLKVRVLSRLAFPVAPLHKELTQILCNISA